MGTAACSRGNSHYLRLLAAASRFSLEATQSPMRLPSWPTLLLVSKCLKKVLLVLSLLWKLSDLAAWDCFDFFLHRLAVSRIGRCLVCFGNSHGSFICNATLVLLEDCC